MTINIASDNLPHPSNFAYRYAQPIIRSGQSTPAMIFATQRDAKLQPGVVLLTWQNALRTVVEAVYSHFVTYAGTFVWHDAIEDVTRNLIWVHAPSVTWVSPTTANVVGEFEIALAHD